MRVKCRHKEFYAKASYERFILSNPHINCNGLFKDETGWFYVVCPNSTADTLALDGSRIIDWFGQHKAISSPIRLKFETPKNAVKVQTRTIEDMIQLTGNPLTIIEVFEKFKKYLPRYFPLVKIQSVTKDKNFVTIFLSRALNERETSILTEVVHKIDLPVDVETKIIVNEDVAPQRDLKKEVFHGRLLPSFYSPSNTPKILKTIYEQDEDYWTSSEIDIFKDPKYNFKDIYNSKNYKNSCIVNASAFPSINFRTLFTLYDHIYLALPLEHRLGDFLESIQISRDDLVELAGERRLTPILPFSFERYVHSDIEPLIETNTESIIGPRRLSALSIVATRQRFPLLYTSWNAEERAAVLRVLFSISEKVQAPESVIIQQLVFSLSRIWQATEDLVQHRGNLGTKATGLGALYGDLVKGVAGRDAWLEITTAAQTLEWGIGLESDMIPTQAEGYDEYVNASNLAALYSGFNRYPYITAASKSGIILDNLLAINNEMPVMELVNAIGTGDRERLKNLVRPAAEKQLSREELQHEVNRFNKVVLEVEKKSSKLSKFNISGLIQGLAGPVGILIGKKTESLELGFGIASIGLMQWVNQQLSNHRTDNQILGAVYDGLMANITNTDLDAVFVARVRNQLKS